MKTVTLGEIADFKNGLNFRANESGFPIKVLGVGDFQKFSRLDQVKNLTTIHTDKEINESYHLKNGDIVFVRSNGNKELVGRSLLVYTDGEPVSFSGFTIRARLLTDEVKPEYVNLLMQAGLLKATLKREGAGTNISNLNQDILAKLPIQLISIDDQEKVLNYIASWDTVIETTERLIAAKERYLNGLVKQILITDQMKYLKKAKLGTICDINKGTQLNKTDMIGNATYPVINGGIGPSGYTDQWNADAYSIAISEGGNSCGYVNYMTEKFWSGGHCYTLKNVKINQEYLFHFLKANEKFIMALRVGSGLPNIQKKSLEKFEVHYPDKEAEQARIAEILNTAKREIDLLKKLAESYRLQKRGLMQKLLSGEWRLDRQKVS